MRTLSRKERMRIPRQVMPERDPAVRAGSWDEVNLGYDTDRAMLEAERCLRCPVPKCVDGCPVGVRIGEFVALAAEGDFGAAAEVISRDNSLPAICGRVCPQEIQCEAACVLGKRHQPVAIGHLERFVADFAFQHGVQPPASPPTPTGRRVAVVGSGPAGLACAADLARRGHEVTVFEALHALGGVLMYGIPDYRLPGEVVQTEISVLEDLGVRFETNVIIGLSDTVDELLGELGFDAVFLGVGAGLPRFLSIPGEDLIGVYSANEFLTRVNLMQAYRGDAETPLLAAGGHTAVVFGGGNTAMDAVRTALRLGAETAAIMYRRTEAEMPARIEEIHHAREEGVVFDLLVAPVAFHGNDEGRLESITLRRMELGEPDEGGRRRPVPIPGSEFQVRASMAIVAIGNDPNPLIGKTTPDLELTKWGTVAADPESGLTSKPGVFAGGDIVTGGATVILAMGAGRQAAAAIDDYLCDAAPEPAIG